MSGAATGEGAASAAPAVYRLIVDVRVDDEAALLAYANRRTQAAFGTTVGELTSGGETQVERALLEALVYSNENPSPDEWGVELGVGKSEVRRVS